MIKIKCESKDERTHALELIEKIENEIGSRLFCIYQDQTIPETLDDYLTTIARTALQETGKLEKLTVLIDSPGGDADATFRLLRVLRRFTDKLDVIVVNWCKSAATLFCLGADNIFMSVDAELGPLDAQVRNPKNGRYYSALNTFKSLEYLKQYGIEVLNDVSRLFKEGVGMDFIYAVEAARPIASDMVTALYNQVSPSELGEARRHLAIGEQYAKIIMERYSYREYPPKEINRIVRSLVWNYPSHGFVIDIEEAKQLGLRVEPLSDGGVELCEELLATVKGCIGIVTETDKQSAAGNNQNGDTEPSLTVSTQEGVSDEIQAQTETDGHHEIIPT